MALIDGLDDQFFYRPQYQPPAPVADEFANFDANDAYNGGPALQPLSQEAPIAQAPAPASNEPTWNSEWQAWQDQSGNIWDPVSGVWFDPNTRQVYREGVGFQSVEQYNDYNNVLNEFSAFAQNPVVAQPSIFRQDPTTEMQEADWALMRRAAEQPAYTQAMLEHENAIPYDTSTGYGSSALNLPPTRRNAAEDFLAQSFSSIRNPETDTDSRFPTGAMFGSNPLSSLYNKYNEYVANPIAETASQITPILNTAAAPGGFFAGELAGRLGYGNKPSDSIRGGLNELGSAIKEGPTGFIGAQNENFAERPMWQQLAASTAYDPTNLIGAGIGAKALKTGIEGTGALSAIARAAAKADNAIDIGTSKALGAGLKYGGRELAGAGIGVVGNELTGGELPMWQAAGLGALGGNVTRRHNPISELLAQAQGRGGLSPALGAQIDDVTDPVVRELLGLDNNAASQINPNLRAGPTAEDAAATLAQSRSMNNLRNLSQEELQTALKRTDRTLARMEEMADVDVARGEFDYSDPEFVARAQQMEVLEQEYARIEDELARRRSGGGQVVYHGTAGELDGPLRADAFVTTNRADAEAFARAESRISGKPPRVYEFEAAEGSLRPVTEEGLASARGAQQVADPSGLRNLASNEEGSSRAGLSAQMGLTGVAGAAGYLTADEEASMAERFGRAAAFGAVPALGPTAAKTAYKAIPKKAKTALVLDNALTSIDNPLPLGDTGIKEALARKEETTAVSGPLGRLVSKIPGADTLASLANPSVTLDRVVHVANQAAHAVRGDIATRFTGSGKAIIAQIEDSFGKFKKSEDGYWRPTNGPEYIGPPERTIAGTLVDIAENPQDYKLTPFQQKTIELMEARDAMNINFLRSKYGVDVSLVKPSTGGIYMPRINANEDLIDAGLTTQARLANPGIGKPRVYETAAERIQSAAARGDAKPFIPETNPAKLLAAHDNQLARMAGDNTFKAGSGGQTKVELVDEFFPEIKKAKEVAQNRLKSLKGQLDRRIAKEGTIAKQIRQTLAKQGHIEERMEPFLERVRDLEATGEYGPELSHFAGQIYELRRDAAVLERIVAGTPKTPGLAGKLGSNDKEIQSLMKQIDAAQEEADKLISRYKGANFAERAEKVFSPVTNRYHDPSVAKGVGQITEDSNNTFLKIADYSRGTALSLDLSPFTIQGTMNILRSPFKAITSIATVAREGGANLADVARREPELVSRYTQAKARALGKVSDEFDPTESLIALIPKGVGKTFVAGESAMFDILQRLDYELWKSTTNRMRWLNPDATQNVIDHETANALSKSVPSMSGVERGVSPKRGRQERAFLTSTSFLASPGAVLKDAGSAVAKLAVGKRPRIREQIALMHSIEIATTVSLITGSSALLTARERNLSPEDALRRAFDPNHKDFMSLHLPGGKRVTVGGPFRSFIKAMNPISSDLGIQEPKLIQWAEGRIAPLPGALLDIVRNEDWDGDKIHSGERKLSSIPQSAYYLVEQAFAPIGVGSAMEKATEGGSLREVIGELGVQATGSAPQNETPTDKLDKIARAYPDNGGKGFYDSPLSVQREIRERHPDLYKQAVEAGSETRQAVFEQEEKLLAQQNASDAALKNNDIDAAQWREARSEKYAALRNFKDGAYSTADPYKGDDPILESYFKAIGDAIRPDGTIDWDRVEAYEGGLSEAHQKHIADETGLSIRTEKTKEYRSDMAKIDKAGYWEIEDQLWVKFAEVYEVPDGTTKEQYWTGLRKQLITQAEEYLDIKKPDWRTIYPNAAVELADPEFDSKKRKFTGVVSDERKKWRAAHPEEASILAKWRIAGYGASETADRVDEALSEDED